MQLDDAEMVRQLAARDGAVSYRRHVRPDEPCPYEELYSNGSCPWCEAERRRLQRETAESDS
jgi:hypothetical protein